MRTTSPPTLGGSRTSPFSFNLPSSNSRNDWPVVATDQNQVQSSVGWPPRVCYDASRRSSAELAGAVAGQNKAIISVFSHPTSAQFHSDSAVSKNLTESFVNVGLGAF